MKILGIETSCDETAAAVVKNGQRLLSNVVTSSVDLHAAFGGVVPEIAARSHLEVILPVIDQALKEAYASVNKNQKLGTSQKKTPETQSQFLISKSDDPWSEIDAVAVTQGPGLGGSLLVGLMTAQTLAWAKNKPIIPVNHVEAHVYAGFITSSASLSTHYQLPTTTPKFPILALIVSGGHSQLVLFKTHSSYRLLGQTRDDAVGEAFDKVAKIIGLPYPGGPSVAAAAKSGNPEAIDLPTAKMANPYDFSFSGLKTAVLRAAQSLAGMQYDFPSTQLPEALNDAQKADIAASFQKTAVQTLVNSLKKAETEFKPASIVVAGGVAANMTLREELLASLSTPVFIPDIKLCTDNAAMIGCLAFYNKDKQLSPSAPSLSPLPSLSM